MLDKIVDAGVNSTSFAQGSEHLAKLAEAEVPTKQVERVCRRIGAERVAQRDEAVEAYQGLPLTQRKAVPAGVTAAACRFSSVAARPSKRRKRTPAPTGGAASIGVKTRSACCKR